MHNNENEYKRISDLVLAKIETDKAVPRSKAYFVLRNVLMWSLAIFSLVFGALSISSILFRISNIAQVLPPSVRLEYSFDMFNLFPVFWVMVFGLFVYVACLEIRHTKQGYKYHLSWVVGSMLVVSGILGVTLYYLGVGFILDKVASRFVPFNRDIEMLQKDRWLSPETGFLVGEVEKAEDEQEVFILRDPEDIAWEVLFSGALTDEEKDLVREGRKIGLQGMVAPGEDHLFIACKIVSVEIRGRGKFAMPVSRVRMLVEADDGTSSERNFLELRTNVCEGVRPQKEVMPVIK